MGARKKLNVAYFNGALILAAAVGVLAGSWQVFAISLAGLVVVYVFAGNIRFRGRK